MITKMLARMGGVAAAFVVLTGAARDSVPEYYAHGEYYSNARHTTQVGGWLSCPPSQGGYTSWGTTSQYQTYTSNDYAACLARYPFAGAVAFERKRARQRGCRRARSDSR